MYQYKAIVERIHDGDTITVTIDAGFDLWMRNVKLRLYGPDPAGDMGLNAPELVTTEGKVALTWLKSVLKLGDSITMTTVKDRKEKYGRYLTVITLADGRNLNQLLLDSGNAKLQAY